jgi:hypothetical protein
MDPVVVIPEVLGIAIVFAILPTVLVGWSAARGLHPVVCPETGQGVTVRVDPNRGALRLFTGGSHRVCGCSRWPERAGCDRACEGSVLA